MAVDVPELAQIRQYSVDSSGGRFYGSPLRGPASRTNMCPNVALW